MSDHDDDMNRRLKNMANRITVPPRPELKNAQASPSRLHFPWLRVAAAAAACVLSVAGAAAFAIIDSRDNDVSVNTGSTPGPSVSSGPPVELRRLLIDLGVDVDRAPAEVLDAGEAQICGSIDTRPDRTSAEVERRCFLDAHLANVPAVLVELQVTVEGDPVVTVHRTTSTGAYTLAVDATQDSFGSRDWYAYACDRLTTRVPGAPEALTPVTFSPSGTCTDVEGRPDASTVPSLGPAPDVPRWFSDRPDLPLCGIDVRIEDNDREHRSCFRQAVAAGTPAEFAYTSTGDEGEMGAFWYRSLGPSDIEVFERQLPQPGTPGAWVRYACTSAGFLDEPGSEVDLLPFSHAGTDCTRVEEQPG